MFLDSVTTLRGTGFSYRTYEPASGTAHASGLVRDRRIRAGLRYSVDGRRKYWLNQPGLETDAYGRKGESLLKQGLAARPIHEARRLLEERLEAREGYAPLSHDDLTGGVVHVDPEWAATQSHDSGGLGWWEGGRAYESIRDDHDPGDDDGLGSDVDSLEFHDPREADEKEVERLYREAREHEYGASLLLRNWTRTRADDDCSLRRLELPGPRRLAGSAAAPDPARRGRNPAGQAPR